MDVKSKGKGNMKLLFNLGQISKSLLFVEGELNGPLTWTYLG